VSKFCEEALTHFTTDDKIFALKKTLEYPMDDSEFAKEYITEKDRLFLKSLIYESSSSNELLFSHLKGTTRANGFISKVKYLPNVTIFKNTSNIKSTITTEYSFDKVLYSLIPLFQKKMIISGTDIKNFELIKEIPKDELKEKYNMDEDSPLFFTGYDLVSIPGFVEKRKILDMTIMEYDVLTKTFYLYVKPRTIFTQNRYKPSYI
jgi:hypothetical protein